jgi:uncharacterized protein with NRDE domain
MCTLIMIDRILPDFPVVAAANRDEFYLRPSAPPQVLCSNPWIIGPRDEQAGGTWIGVAGGRLLAGLTNRKHEEGWDPSRRSRGEVTLRALRAGSVEGALDEVGSIPPGRYNGFNFFCADSSGAGVVVYQSGTITRRLEPGIHVVTTNGVDNMFEAKTLRIRAILGDPASIRSHEEAFERLECALRDHDGEQLLDRVCIHGEGYGTRSATLIAIHATDPARSHYLHVEGRACETPWKDVSCLIRSAPMEIRAGEMS